MKTEADRRLFEPCWILLWRDAKILKQLERSSHDSRWCQTDRISPFIIFYNKCLIFMLVKAVDENKRVPEYATGERSTHFGVFTTLEVAYTTSTAY